MNLHKRRLVRSREFSQNFMHHIWDRESGFNRHNLRGFVQFSHEREFYKSITPRLTVQNVDKPHGYIRKFSPDGQLLLSFSNDQRSLEVYKYLGVGRVADLLFRLNTDCITAADHSLESLHIRQQIFDRLFQLQWIIRPNVSNTVHFTLNREFSIFLENGRYALIAGITVMQDIPTFQNNLKFPDINDDCELYAYDFILVNLQNGSVSDILVYRNDFIMLAHNHGVSAYDSKIALLSKYRQCIELVWLTGGKLVRLYTIASFACDLHEAEYNAVFDRRYELTRISGGLQPFTYIRHCVISYLYKQIIQISNTEIKRKRLQEFYRNYHFYEHMIIAKMQLVDEDTLLLRYERRPNTPFHDHIVDSIGLKLYVFYSISLKKVLQVYTQHSISLMHLLRNHCDSFRNVRSLHSQRSSSSPSNNAYFFAAFNSAMSSIPGGFIEAALRFNPTLPISTQSFATSQYLDYNLFNYDDRLISALERPKVVSTRPIIFRDRETNLIKFRMHLEASNDVLLPGNNRELVAYVFHPFEPIIISLQKFSRRFVVNLHVYNVSTVVKNDYD